MLISKTILSRRVHRPALQLFQTSASVRRSLSSSSLSSHTTATAGRPERPRRALFSVPGSTPKFLTKAQTLGADAVVLDLEDGVALSQKDAARQLVSETLQDNNDCSFGRSEVCVRINGLETAWAQADLDAILACDKLQAVVIPKVETAEHVQYVAKQIDARNHRDVRILAAIESATGMLNIRDICSASPTKLDAIIFASEDYCSDLEAIRTAAATELLWARSTLVTAAKAYNLQAIDMVHINFRDTEDLIRECQTGRELGFTGKQAIHPLQIPHIHEAFSPSPKDVEFAKQATQQYEKATESGLGACEVEGIVVDLPVYKWAVKILKRAQASGMLGN